MRYLRTTKLGWLHAEARIDRTDGVKTYVVGHLADEEGVTVEAEGVFIKPTLGPRLIVYCRAIARLNRSSGVMR